MTSFISLFNIKWIKKVNQEFDLIINYNTLAIGFFYSFFRCPIVYDIADDLVSMVRDSPQIVYPMKIIGIALAKFYLQTNIKKSSLISISAKTLRQSYGIPNNKTIFIPNGVDTSFFKYDSNSKELRERLGLTDDLILGYIGVLREWVDFNNVFRAIKKINKNKIRSGRVKIVIVGKEGNEKRIRDLSISMGITNDVLFIGEIPYHHAPLYISMFNIGLIPFKQNSITKNALPLKLFEYAACGKPIISTPIPEVIRIMRDKILYANSPEEYYKAIKCQSEEIDDLDNNNIALRNHIKGKYDWKQISTNFEKKIMSLVHG